MLVQPWMDGAMVMQDIIINVKEQVTWYTLLPKAIFFI